MAVQFTTEFEVQDRNANQYQTFISNLRPRLATSSIHGVPTLRPLEDDASSQLFDLVLRTNNRSVTLRIRMDNLYLLGYKMGNGQWLELNNTTHIHSITEPGTKFLGFGGNYTQLERAAHMSRDDISIGSQTLINAIHVLATSEQGEARARSLMTVIVMFLEAIRLINVQDFVTQNYTQGARIGSWNSLMRQIHTWGQLSKSMVLMDAIPEGGHAVQQLSIGIALHANHQAKDGDCSPAGKG